MVNEKHLDSDGGSSLDVLNLRSAVFTIIFICMFYIGFWLNGYEGPQIILGIITLLLIIPIMAAQAFYNGSWVLTFLLSPSPIVGFWVPTTELILGPELYFKLFIAISLGWLLGLTGHLIGIVLGDRKGRTIERDNFILYAAAGLLLLLSILYLL